MQAGGLRRGCGPSELVPPQGCPLPQEAAGHSSHAHRCDSRNGSKCCRLGRCSTRPGSENPSLRRGQTPSGCARCAQVSRAAQEAAASHQTRGSRRLRATSPTAPSPRKALLTETRFLAARRQALSRRAGTRLPAEVPSVGGGASVRPRPSLRAPLSTWPIRTRLIPECGETVSSQRASSSPRQQRPGVGWASAPGGSLRALVAPRGGELDAGAGKAA